MIIIDILEKSASEFPDKIAVTPFNKAPISYLNLRDSVYGYIMQLMEFKIGSKTRIGFMSNDSCQLVKLVYSISSLCIAVPLDNNLKKNQYDSMFELLKLDYMILGNNPNESVMQSIKEARIPVICLEETTADSLRHPLKKDNEIALLLTTSGTTSTPKIVPWTHRNIISGIKAIRSFFELTNKDCALILMPVSKGVAINAMLSSHISGGSIVLMTGFNHLDFINALDKYPISFFSASPAVLKSIVSYAHDKNLDFRQSSLRYIRSSGAPISTTLRTSLESLFATKVVKSYGMTETLTLSSTYNLDMKNKENSVGVSIGNEFKIHNGEILVKGHSVFNGYLDAPEVNKDIFIGDWFRTGDLGRIDDDGFIYIIGRIKEMINRGGEKVSPYEVEEYLEKHPHIKQAVVFPKIDNQNNEEVASAIVLEDNVQIDVPSLRNFLSDYISSYKIPTVYYVADRIPVGKSGKFQRNIMSEHFSGVRPLGEAAVEKAEIITATESVVKKYYEKILNKKNLGIHQNFFDAGGDSLLASVLHSELMDAFETDIPVHALFDYPEIGKLSRFIDAMEREKRNLKFVVPLKKCGFKKPLFFIHSLDGDALGYYPVATRLDPDRPAYGIQFKYDDCWTSPLDFSQIAKKYIEEIKLVQSSGPYLFAGICLGGQIAYEIARQLTSENEDVSFLAMFDVILISESDATCIPKNTIMKKSIRTMRQLKEINPMDYWKLLSRKANSLYLYLSNKYIVKINKKKGFLFKNKRALLTQASSISHHKPYAGPVVYYQAKDSTPKSELSANAWKKLIPNIKVIEVDMEHNDFNNPLMATQVASLLYKELRCKDD